MIDICHTWDDALRTARLSPVNPRATYGLLADFPFFNSYQAGATPVKEYLEALADFLGLADPMDALKAHNSIIVREQEGIPELVNELRRQGLLVGCMSNTNDLHWSELISPERFPTIASLEVKIASHVVGSAKPDAGIYETFEDAVGTTGPHIVYFDDYTAYIEAGLARHWHAVHVDAYKPSVPQMRKALVSLGVLTS